ncbi:hypothetical protein BBP40_009855 [Aspergillus hancockii]|nr:hypothetical protein BBP40_009855 [Aspergillus hancockii]
MIFTTVLVCYLSIFLAEAATVADLASTLVAVSKTLDATRLTNCSLDHAPLPFHPRLPGPSPGVHLKYVTLGRGTQNYICAEDSNTTAPRSVGAVATLLDASCLVSYNSTLFHYVTPLVKRIEAETVTFLGMLFNQMTSTDNHIITGKHEFTADKKPYFDLRLGGSKEWVVAKGNATGSAGPDNTVNVPWLKLTSVDGVGITDIYRVFTVGGQPPNHCGHRKGTFKIDYAAQYWFYGP